MRGKKSKELRKKAVKMVKGRPLIMISPAGGVEYSDNHPHKIYRRLKKEWRKIRAERQI